MFDSEDQAKQALPDYFVDDMWLGNTIPNLSLTTKDGIAIPGFFINIALDEPSQALIDLPNNVCRLVSDREAAALEENFFYYIAPSLDVKLLSNTIASPVFMGSEYPFCDNKENQTRPE